MKVKYSGLLKQIENQIILCSYKAVHVISQDIPDAFQTHLQCSWFS